MVLGWLQKLWRRKQKPMTTSEPEQVTTELPGELPFARVEPIPLAEIEQELKPTTTEEPEKSVTTEPVTMLRLVSSTPSSRKRNWKSSQTRQRRGHVLHLRRKQKAKQKRQSARKRRSSQQAA